MDFPTIVLIILGVTVVLTVMAAGGLKELLPPKAPAPGRPARPASTDGEDDALIEGPDQAGRGIALNPRRAQREDDRVERDDSADNFFSDEDDFAFRDLDHNRGPFSQREEDRDSLDDPDRSR